MILALDYGLRYIGIAITDPDGRLALRHSVIDQRQTDAITHLTTLCESEQINSILVGVPLSLSGNRSEQTTVTEKFIEHLRQGIPRSVQIESVDETLTSHEAEARLKAEGGSLTESHAEAARLMLESYLRNQRSI